MSKPLTSYTRITKPYTAFSAVPKAKTFYDATGGSVGSLTLNDPVVKLNSTVYLLSGYTGTTPNQLSNKPKTTYTAP